MRRHKQPRAVPFGEENSAHWILTHSQFDPPLILIVSVHDCPIQHGNFDQVDKSWKGHYPVGGRSLRRYKLDDGERQFSCHLVMNLQG